MFLHYLKVAFRHFCEDKMQYIISMTGIAFGVFCFCITLYYIRERNNEYAGFPHYADIAELRITEQGSSYEEGMIPEKIVRALKEDHSVVGIEKVATHVGWNDANITFLNNDRKTTPFLCRIALVNRDFFDVFSCRLVAGRISLQPGEAILSASCARKVYGEGNAVGQQLCFTPAGGDMEKAGFSRIVGVVEDFDVQSSLRSEVYFPADGNRAETKILLVPHVSEREVNKRLGQLNLLPEQPQKRLKVVRVSSIPISDEEMAVQLLVLFIASLVLIAGLINFLKNCVYVFYSRTKELSLRKQLGAGRLSLFWMLFLEIMLVLLGAGALSLCISELLASHLYLFFPSELSDKLYVDLAVLLGQQMGFVAVVCVVCGLIGWWAVVRMEGKRVVIQGLCGMDSGRGGKHGIRNFMIGFQIFICIVFIAGTLGFHFIYRNMEQDRYFPLSHEELRNIWCFDLSEPQVQGRENEISSQIIQLSGVKEVLRTSYRRSVTYEIPQGGRMHGEVLKTGKNYFSFYTIPVQGSLPDEGQAVVVPQVFWERLQADTALTDVVLGGRHYQVTGHYEREPFSVDLRGRSFTAIAFSERGNCFYVKCVEGRAGEVKRQIDRIVRHYLPVTLPFKVVSQEESIYQTSKSQFDVLRNLFAILSVIAIVITMMGIYSTITIDSLSRQKEVAIRKVNGASMKDVVSLFGRLYLRLWGVATVIAFPALFLLTTTVSDNFGGYAVHFSQLWFWLIVFGLAAFLIFMTVAYRIRKISKLNPVVMVRKD